ncbi:MAG: NAD(+)/NADH kinase [Planctomycetia bacterium]|nr:NAD(+)/NADH kinase [Planctomycetia bacterium]
MKVLILGYQKRSGVCETIEVLRPQIERCAEIVLEDLTGTKPLDDIQADVALVFGGDGSILRAVKQMGARQLPVLPINLGRLGFLADVAPEDLIEKLWVLSEFILLAGASWSDDCLEKKHFGASRVSENHFLISEHRLLDCIVSGPSFEGEPRSALVMNEVAIQNAAFHIMEVKLYADGEFVTTYSCDGLILSTPIGSTAHNLSAGGPILRQGLDVVVISPIAPHTLTYRPVVDSARRTFQLNVISKNIETATVVDGKILAKITPEDTVLVRPSNVSFKMLNVPGYSYYRTLQKKLGWSGQPRYGKEKSKGH